MAEAITIARPYANAAFDIANEKVDLKTWSGFLAVMAQSVVDEGIETMIANPSISDEQVISILVDIAGELVTTEGRHFLALLAENKRLPVLMDIAVIFEQLRADAEQVMTAEVSSARALTPEQEANIAKALKKRTGRDVTLSVEVDESLLGGAIIRAGDLIIDGSALGKLNRLANVIN